MGSPVNVTAGAHDTATATSATFTPTALGYWCFAATYSGSTNYQTVTDTSTGECFNVTQATSSTTTVPANTAITLGQASTDAATVTGNAGGGSPTGTVTFYECGPTSTATACTSTASTAHPIGTPVNLTAGAHNTSTATSGAFTPSAVGYWCFAAYYSGDTNYKASTDTAVNECVDVKGSLAIVTTSLPARAGWPCLLGHRHRPRRHHAVPLEPHRDASEGDRPGVHQRRAVRHPHGQWQLHLPRQGVGLERPPAVRIEEPDPGRR